MSQSKSNQAGPQDPTEIRMKNTENYREGYANSVQVRMSVWDFQLIFGTAKQDAPNEVNLENFQGIYLSPQQAKALCNVLGQNLAQYEQTFGKLTLEPRNGAQAGIQIVLPNPQQGGPVN